MVRERINALELLMENEELNENPKYDWISEQHYILEQLIEHLDSMSEDDWAMIQNSDDYADL